MKTLLIAAALSLVSVGAFANEAAKAPAAAPAVKMTKTDFKKECQEEGKNGKDLKACVKAKKKAAKA